jgi:predicted Fe-Mo cluster-binding NifX family protein
MRIGVSATGKELNARVDDRFGRCPWFLVVDTDSLEFDPLENRHAEEATGAGVAVATDLIDAHVDAVVSGQVGPKAYEVLKAMGIDIFLVSGSVSVKDALERLKRGELQKMQMRVF